MVNVMAMFKEVRAGSTVSSADVGTPSVDDVTPHYGVMGMSLHEEREDKYYLPAKATDVRMVCQCACLRPHLGEIGAFVVSPSWEFLKKKSKLPQKEIQREEG
ncbi:hypothetical protein Taro_015188 [Colocasia esculenta]|uniref:Uncharacterized protein n=1 Tax=Colocasia esculenta TaxID=4460 RepID=A0A843UGW6_COLES|nr:hypothetical protein [Colocasia esculenta]